MSSLRAPRSAGPAPSVADVAVVVALALLALLPMFLGGADDDEGLLVELPWINAIYDTFRHGGLPLWSERMGIGMPIPYGSVAALHPLAPVFGLFEIRTATIIWFTAHLLLGSWFLFRFCTEIGCARLPAYACTGTWLFSSSAMNYLHRSYWPVPFFTWAFAPVVLFTLLLLLKAPTSRERAWAAVALGLATGFWLLNSHPGHSSIAVASGAVFVAVAWRPALNRWTWLALAGLIAAAIVGYRVELIAHELALQPEGLERATSGYTGLSGYLWALFLKPIVFLSPGDLGSAWSDGGLAAVLVTLKERYVDANASMRVVFIGPLFVFLALWATVRPVTRSPWRLPLAAATLFSAAVSLSPVIPSRLPSAQFLFSDSVGFFGIPLVGLVLTEWLAAGRGRVVAMVLAVHGALLFAGALPSLYIAATATAHDGSSVAPRSYAGFDRETALPDFLRELGVRPQQRIYVSPGAAALSEVWVLNRHFGPGLAAKGFAVVTGHTFKGVTLDALHPDRAMGIAMILPQQDVAANAALLDLLAVEFVLAGPDEAVAADLRPVGRFKSRLDREVVVYANADAWPGAGFVDFAGLELPVRPACGHDRLLCRDVTALSAGRESAAPVQVDRIDGMVRAIFAPEDRRRTLLFATPYEARWNARDQAGDRLTAVSIAGLIGIEVPAGTTAVSISYESRVTVALFFLSVAAALAAVVVLIGARSSRRRAALPAT